VDSCTNSRGNFFTISFLWWVKCSVSVSSNSQTKLVLPYYKIHGKLGHCHCAASEHVCQSLAVACAHRNARARLHTCVPANLPMWMGGVRKLAPMYTHALSFSFSSSWFVLCKVFTTPGKLLRPVAAHGTWWQWEWGWDYFM